MRTEVHQTSLIFDKAAREQPFETFVSRQALEFKVATKERMITSHATGRLYPRKRGTGFTRHHRASSRGQRPAPDTLTLVNAIAEKTTSRNTAEVFIDERMNPANGSLASDYGAILQFGLDRPIQSDEDAAQAEAKMTREGNEMILQLL